MITIICRDELYTYNVYHLVKAFFPGEEVRQQVDAEADRLLKITLPDGQQMEVNIEDLEQNREIRQEEPGAERSENLRRQRKYLIDTWLYQNL